MLSTSKATCNGESKFRNYKPGMYKHDIRGFEIGTQKIDKFIIH